ncbi:MAG: type II restriction endonuclease [Kiritimatiellae bacterium]|nr:type II restriction endonuclease [Kiritimatiellia bacterium]
MIGIPLKDWDISINYGIKTGFNDAFIIDEAKRNEILAGCKTDDERKRTVELIRPILRGRDIKRYAYSWAGLYLIATHNGIPEKGIPRVEITKYPAVKKHLDFHWPKIKARADQGDTPYNLRSCAYMDDFSKPKIVWGNLALAAQFSAAPAGMFINAPCPMIVPFDGYLLAILNSKLGDWYIRHLGVTRNGGYFEYKPMFIEQLPVPETQSNTAERLSILAKDPTVEGQAEIDQIVFELFHLTRAEIDCLETQSLRG